MRKTLSLITLVTITFGLSQGKTGINTTTPKVTLDVVGSVTETTVADGVIAPRITRTQLIAKTGYGSDQTGAIIYVTDTSGSTNTTTAKVTDAGYYYFDGTLWQKLVDEIGYLEKLTENGKTGYRIRGLNPDNYGDIGINAVDLSHNNTASSTHGSTGDYSTAMGVNNTASGMGSTAMGVNNKALGLSSIAMGEGTTALGDGSTAMGEVTTASGRSSTAMGDRTTASGISSMAMGKNTTASGENSIAMGQGSTASGNTSTAIGSATASGSSSIAMGVYNAASGNISTAMGYRTIASGVVSTAIGYGTVAFGQSSIAIGRYNTVENNPEPNNYSQNNNRLLVLGNGTEVSMKSDAFTVLRNSKVGIDIDNFENTTSDAKLQVNGDIKIGTSNSTCDANNRGNIKYENDNFYGCKSTGWVLLNN